MNQKYPIENVVTFPIQLYSKIKTELCCVIRKRIIVNALSFVIINIEHE